MFEKLRATNVQSFEAWGFDQIRPYFDDLNAREVNADNVVAWLSDWSLLRNMINEVGSRLYVNTTINTADEAAEARFLGFLEHVGQPTQSAEQQLKEKLLATGLEPEGFEISLRNMRTDAELFREENVALSTEESKLGTQYDKIIGAQTVQWEGEERTIAQMKPVFQDPDRAARERAWRLVSERQLQDRGALNDLWQEFLTLRLKIADNAGMSDFRAYRWREFKRFDYTPEDCLNFHAAIEQVVVPAAQRIYEKQRQRLGVDTLRPWDTEVDPHNRPPLRPFTDANTLSSTVRTMFNALDPELGEYYNIMERENLLDLSNRKNKAPGGYQTFFEASKRPFIFMNAVGLHDDVQTLLHEGGHAFHSFEASRLPDWQDFSGYPIEFAEVASMSMELLAAPYFTQDRGGFYASAEDAARARIEHFEGMITFWPYMAVVDAFQHWVYTHADAAMNPANCDEEWARQWDRFMGGIDYSGLEDAKVTGWHRKLHIFQIPFYYVEYGLAQLGAAQVWVNSLSDAPAAVKAYRRALSLGGRVTLPELFAAAGAKFAMDAPTLQTAIDNIERESALLDPA